MKELKSSFVFILPLIVFISIAFSCNIFSKKPVIVDQVEDFTLLDYEGIQHSLSDYSDSTAIVILFIATQCPVSNAYNSRMESIFKEYSEQGIAFIGINSNKQEDVEEIAEHAEENNLTFTILKDENNIIADEFAASFTPEVYVLNTDFKVLYHGRIDDSKRESEATTSDLTDALDEIIAGEEVSTPETKAFGCTIKRI